MQVRRRSVHRHPMLATALQTLDFPDSASDGGLVSVKQPGSSMRIEEQAVIRDASAFPDVSHVYFRRFDDGRSSQPAAFVVDNHDEHLDEAKIAILHKRLWLHGVAPLVYVAWPARIDVLTCARGPDFWRDGDHVYEPVEQIELAADVASALAKRRRFSASRLADGTFWDDPGNSVLARHDQSAHESLIRAIVETDNELGESLPETVRPLLRRLLLLSVLIKYLEDRRVFASGWFGRFHKGARTFFDVLHDSTPDNVLRLLEILERKFNGDVFALPEAARRQLTPRVLRRFALMVEARTLGHQRYLWDQYSFQHLPVEVISHLYQRFVQGHGTVYTPPHLASLLLDHAMPYDELRGNERVLDPACGSGVFLVGAFRRLVDVWRSRHQWRDPDVRTLERILHQCIFGIEIDRMAVELTAFSLALAVCDALRSDVIWRDLRFRPLRGTNLTEGDFFAQSGITPGEATSGALGTFDVIIGNPPFESRLSEAGQQVDRHRARERDRIPDQQAAYLFLEQSLALLAGKGRMCLMQPAGFLYNRQAMRFRQHVLRTARVSAILDFVSIRNLFDGADPKAVAVLAEEGQPDPDHAITHLTFRRTFATRQRLGFEIDHYDRHRVPQRAAEDDRPVWRANLFGGGRLAALAERIRSMRTLGAFIEQQGWLSSEGFIIGKRTQEAPYLTGKTFLPTEALTTDGIDATRLGVVEELRFERPRRKEQFQAPLVLIREHESLPAALWERGALAYRHEIVGIHAPTDKQALRDFFATFLGRRRQYQLCYALDGSRALVGKATAILKGDIEALPYPDDPRELDFALWETALQEDVFQYMVLYIRRGQNAELLQRAATHEELAIYREMFCRLLCSVYENLQAADPLFLNGLIAQPFYFGDAPKVDWLGPTSEKHLHRLVYEQCFESLRTVRVVRFYEQNAMLIVKPDRLRYWIRSTAIRDADDTLADLAEQGY